MVERDVEWQLERDAGGSVLGHSVRAVGAGTQLCGTDAFPQNFAEKGERADLTDCQFWHSFSV